MIKELKTLLQKYFGTSSPKPLETKKPTPVRKNTRRERLRGLISEIGKEMYDVRVQIEWGRCPYCESIVQMTSTRIGYFRCGNCREITKQYINGHIAYLPIDDKSALGSGPKDG
jgi:hypothetical protein